MGGGTTQSTSSSQSTDPQVTSTLDQLLGGVSSAYSAGPTYVAPGATTTGSQTAALTAANNPAYATGVNSALQSTNGLLANGGLSAGETSNLNSTNALASQYGQMAMNPAGTQAGKNLINSTLGATNSAFNNSGLFGSDNNQTAATLGVTQGLGQLQQGYMSGENAALGNAFGEGQTGVSNQAALAQLLPSIFQAGQLPSSTAAAIGSAQDTSAQSGANKNLSLLSNLSNILQGTASAGGTTTTSTSPATPWWQSALGIGAALL